jgi:rubredoxin
MKGELDMTGQHRIIATTLVFGLIFGLTSDAGAQQNKLLEEAKEAMEKADPYMGDWQGTHRRDDGSDTEEIVAQMIALGDGTYRANFHIRFNYKWPPIFVLDGRLEGTTVRFSGQPQVEDAVAEVQGMIKDGKFTGTYKGRSPEGEDVSGSFELEKAIRLSPTLGKKPMEGAIVLFDGTKKSLSKWQAVRRRIKGFPWLLKGDAMEVKPRTGGIITKQKFGDCELHIEFRTPFMPSARGQGRGNSGVYLQGRYEVQILDSYGLEGKDNECGGIYKVKEGEPEVNMCAPPTQWQTYDITFRAPRFDANGEKKEPATLTVLHNGVKIQDNVKAEGQTTAAPDRTEKGPGGLYLQDHGNPVQFRNIWLVELPAED